MLCSQRNEWRSERRFGARSTSWLGSCFELRAFTCIANTCPNSQTGSAHCEVIFYSYCTVHADWPMHGFSVHFQNAHAQITFRKSFAFTCPRIRLSTWILIKNTLFPRFKSLIWKSFEFSKGKIRLSNQERAESCSETSFGMWFILLWTGPMFAPFALLPDTTILSPVDIYYTKLILT